MEETNSYTYFSICSNGEVGPSGLESTESGVFDPEDITELLNIIPFRKWKKGDRRERVLNQDAPTAFYGFSSWSAEKSSVDRLDVTKQCIETIKNLKDKIPELLKIKSLYDVDFCICVVPHIYNEESPIIYFEKEIIEFCYLSGTSISIDIYAYQND